ncbi:MAG: hypothetical protein R3Y21_04495 [Mycoplasmatota bacterium]
MKIDIYNVIFVLCKEKSDDIKKNDNYSLKLLTKKNSDSILMNMPFEKCYNLKKNVSSFTENIIGGNKFYLSQVHFLSEKEHNIANDGNLIFLTTMNENNIIDLNENYNLVDFSLKDNKILIIDNKGYEYKTEVVEDEYYHRVNVNDMYLERDILFILMSYKLIRSRLDTTNTLFTFMNDIFTIESLHKLYELILDKQVDKSNFRKKIINYCKESDQVLQKGYRPTKYYEFDKIEVKLWI